jgi:LysM repeat protein
MNTPSPLVPQGSFQGKPRGKTNFRIAVFTVLAVHVVLLGGLLMQGCKKQDETPANPAKTNAEVFPALTNPSVAYYPTNPVAPETNLAQIPAPAPAPTILVEPTPAPTPPAAATQEYVIVRNDTLAKIAKAHGTSVKAIETANPGIKPTKLKPGDKIQIPASAAAAGALSSSTPPTTAAGESSPAATYTVKPGDNLTKIASKHGISIKTLRVANNLKTDQIRVGQKLKIPASSTAQSKGITPVASSNTTTGLATP